MVWPEYEILKMDMIHAWLQLRVRKATGTLACTQKAKVVRVIAHCDIYLVSVKSNNFTPNVWYIIWFWLWRKVKNDFQAFYVISDALDSFIQVTSVQLVKNYSYYRYKPCRTDECQFDGTNRPDFEICSHLINKLNSSQPLEEVRVFNSNH